MIMVMMMILFLQQDINWKQIPIRIYFNNILTLSLIK